MPHHYDGYSGDGAVIVEHRVCVDCRRPFGLTRRQTNPGLLGRRVRCGACRPEHRRRQSVATTRRWRQRRCDTGSAPAYAPAGLERLTKALSGA